MRMTKEEHKKIEHAVTFNREMAHEAYEKMAAHNAAGDHNGAEPWSERLDELDSEFMGMRNLLKAIGYTIIHSGDEWRVVEKEEAHGLYLYTLTGNERGAD